MQGGGDPGRRVSPKERGSFEEQGIKARVAGVHAGQQQDDKGERVVVPDGVWAWGLLSVVRGAGGRGVGECQRLGGWALAEPGLLTLSGGEAAGGRAGSLEPAARR